MRLGRQEIDPAVNRYRSNIFARVGLEVLWMAMVDHSGPYITVNGAQPLFQSFKVLVVYFENQLERPGGCNEFTNP